MQPHDPMCRMATEASGVFCDCALIKAVVRRERAFIAADLHEQAAVANFAVRGKHPKVQMETHAAALRWAASRVER